VGSTFEKVQSGATYCQYIYISRLLRFDEVVKISEPLSPNTKVINSPGEWPANRLHFTTLSANCKITSKGKYSISINFGRDPLAITSDIGEEVGCLDIGDIDFKDFEGPARIVFIGLAAEDRDEDGDDDDDRPSEQHRGNFSVL
jgi:hypothetical protein